ncbi:MAG: hypothetical protein EON54_13050 [Alcaligenaceae bacterium]|nr:MAG: hypothetical protein EON54_13050 [Alcaligenaceae bacterium]
MLAESLMTLEADLPVAALVLDTRATTALRLTSELTLAGVLPCVVIDLFRDPVYKAPRRSRASYGLLICTVMQDPRAGLEDDATPDAPPRSSRPRRRPPTARRLAMCPRPGECLAESNQIAASAEFHR